LLFISTEKENNIRLLKQLRDTFIFSTALISYLGLLHYAIVQPIL